MPTIDSNLAPRPVVQTGHDPHYNVENYPILLGRSGSFDYYGNPGTGWVAALGCRSTCRSTGYGPAAYWRQSLTAWNQHITVTPEGLEWGT